MENKNMAFEEKIRQLEQKETYNRTIIETTQEGFWVVDFTGKITDVNQAYCQMTGYSKKELLGMTIKELDIVETPQKIMAHMDEIIKSGSDKFETKHRRKDGSLIDIEVSTTFAGHDIGLFAFCRDITERREAEKALKLSEEKFKLLFNKAPRAYQSLDIDGYFIEVNQQWLNILGYKRDEVIGKWFGDFLSLPYQEGFRKRFPLFKAQGQIHSEFEMVHKNGNKIIIEFDGKIGYNKDHEFKQTHCILKDITMQQQLEDELKQSEERYKFLFEYSGLAVGFYKTDGTIIHYNKKAAEYMGGKPEDYSGKSVYDIFTKEFAEATMENIMNASMSKDSNECVEFSPLESGDKWFNTTYQRITDHKGNVIGVQAISLDITKRIDALSDLTTSEEKYRLITENISDVISVYNLTKNKYTYISPSIFALRGVTAEEALNENLEDFIVPDYIVATKANLLKNMDDFLNNPKTSNNYINENQQLCKNGETIWVETSTKYRYNLEKDLEAVGISRNIDARKKADALMTYLSYHDRLTSLYNRRFYEEELERLDTERNLPLTLIMADVNGLKLTNDAFGHQEGDILLQTIAQLLKKECRDDEIISRIGGDEFVILIPKCDKVGAKHFINRLNTAISKEKKKKSVLSISIGYAVKESTEQKINIVFKEAEDDMYRHKVAEGLSMRSKTIDLIMNSLFEKSNREKCHSDRVGSMCAAIASIMNFKEEDIQQIKVAGLLHDIGKIGISDTILNKTGKLNTYEWEEMKKHPEIGYRLLSTNYEFSEISDYVRSHQERWDGKGYPRKLKHEEIPIQARIIAVADAFDAMTVKRSYREELSESEALLEIRKYAGTQFDPEVARIFVEKVMNAPW